MSTQSNRRVGALVNWKGIVKRTFERLTNQLCAFAFSEISRVDLSQGRIKKINIRDDALEQELVRVRNRRRVRETTNDDRSRVAVLNIQIAAANIILDRVVFFDECRWQRRQPLRKSALDVERNGRDVEDAADVDGDFRHLHV